MGANNPQTAYSFNQLRNIVQANQAAGLDQTMPEQLEKTCKDLDTFSMGRSGKAAAQRLANAANGISNFPPAGLTAFVDPSGTAIGVERQIGKISLILTVARNLFILIPLSLTWWQLSLATAAYQNDVRLGPPDEINRPFLDLWQQGFIGADPRLFSFSDLAKADFFLFLGLIGLGLIADGASAYARWHGTTARRKLEDAIGDLSKISIILRVGSGTGDLSDLTNRVNATLIDTSAVVSATGLKLDQVTRQMANFTQSTATLSASAATISQQGKDLTAAVDKVAKPADDMATAAKNMDSKVTVLQTTQDATNRNLETLIRNSDASARATRQAADGVTKTMDIFDKHIDRLEAVLDGVIVELQGISTQLPPPNRRPGRRPQYPPVGPQQPQQPNPAPIQATRPPWWVRWFGGGQTPPPSPPVQTPQGTPTPQQPNPNP